jgi:alkanesulfonate monooxygenase SsuD/methylene tetrahydromethanopterin reductase-like flavin-dependent oxidoreductase (luciferase family)
MAVQFAYMPDTHGGPYDQPAPDREQCARFCQQLVQEAVTAEVAGFDGVFVPERHARTETMWPSPLLALMAIAMRTERVRLGTYVLQPSYYNPAHLAEDAALVDMASRGRLILGVGPGYHPGYFAHFGEPFGQRLGRFLEAMAFLRQAWTSERFDWHGKYWQMTNVLVNPKPYQQPAPPIWYAVTAPAFEKPRRRAARQADGIALLSFYFPLEDLCAVIRLYRSEARAAGRTPVVAILFDGFVGETLENARQTFGPLWADEIRYYIKWGALPPTPDIPDIAHATQDRLEKYMVLGDVARVTEVVTRFCETLELGDDDWFIFRSRLPYGPAFSQVLDSIRRFGAEVIPRVRGM